VQGQLVEEDDFWCRYFYKMSTLHEDEQRFQQAISPTLKKTSEISANLSPESTATTTFEAESRIASFLCFTESQNGDHISAPHRENEVELPTDDFSFDPGFGITPRTANLADQQTLDFISRMESRAREKEENVLSKITEDMGVDDVDYEDIDGTETDSDSSIGSPLHRESQTKPPLARMSPAGLPKLALGVIKTPVPISPKSLKKAVDNELTAPSFQANLSPESPSGGKHAAIMTSRRGRVEALTACTMQAESTYLEDPKDAVAFQSWTETFPIDKVISKTDILLEQHPEIIALHSKLVPHMVENNMFWARFFFALKQQHESEQAFEKSGQFHQGSPPKGGTSPSKSSPSLASSLGPKAHVQDYEPDRLFYEDEDDIYEL